MQALLIASGERPKLQPLTEQIPSAMIPVMNRPVMLYNLEMLGRLGFKQILVSVSSMASSIESYFGSGRRWGLSLEYILHREALGSAGVLRFARRLIREPFIVMPADEIADLDISQAIDSHCSPGSYATVIVQPGSPYSSRGLLCDEAGHVLSASINPGGRGPVWTDTGIYLFTPDVLNLIPSSRPYQIHQHLIPLLLAHGITVDAFPLPGYWNPLETFQSYAEAQHIFLSKARKDGRELEEKITYRFHSLDTQLISQGVWAGRNSRIDPRARLVPPVSIGNRTWIGDEVELGPSAVVGSNVIIDRGATVSHSVILDNTYVGKLVNLENRLVNQDQLIDLRTNESTRVDNPILLGITSSKFIERRARRAFDCILASLFLFFCLPVWLPVAFLLKISTGQVLQKIPCRSPRPYTGNSGKEKRNSFDLLQFNTRKKNGQPFPLGRWVERWDVKRLPELMNVLKGDLAVVGLKPVTAEMASGSYATWLLEQDEVPGGFSGLWYVQNDEDSTPEEGLVADAYYLATRSWIHDWLILLRTPLAWYRRTHRKFKSNFQIVGGVENGDNKSIGRRPDNSRPGGQAG